MNIRPLGIFLPAGARVGVLFQYRLSDDAVTTRFVADEAFIGLASQPTLSALYLANTPAEQETLWRDVRSTVMNGSYSNKNGWLLPAFFQNLLPEGVFRAP
ncbi:MAG: type II toxin-antitoxin system HipA family toxin, partial [Methylibium sp.]|nr:type II toxin-antitoxin system HipA family toxin [Methylibium sp.]